MVSFRIVLILFLFPFNSPVWALWPSKIQNSTPTTSSSSSSKPTSSRYKGKYYTYKTFKRLNLPSLAYSVISNAAFRLIPLSPTEVPSSLPNLDKNSTSQKKSRRRVAIVTGSNTGVGFETAKSLVHDHGFEVVLACRSKDQGIGACQAINEAAPSNTNGMAVFVQALDLVELSSVRSFAEAIQAQYERVDVLVNNAGRNSAEPFVSTNDDTEAALNVMFAANFLGHFLLTNLLLEQHKKLILQGTNSNESTSNNKEDSFRVVNLSSIMHHFPTYGDASNDLQDIVGSTDYWKSVALEPTPYDEATAKQAYAPSKLAAVFFSMELNRRYGQSLGVESIAVNPGSVYSDIWRNYSKSRQQLMQKIFLTPRQGATTSLAAATMEWESLWSSQSDAVPYLQPYRLPGRAGRGTKPPYPLFEMLGPYQGYKATMPRLPQDGGQKASQSLFQVCEELTQCQFNKS